jgi:hypothetical protein
MGVCDKTILKIAAVVKKKHIYSAFEPNDVFFYLYLYCYFDINFWDTKETCEKQTKIRASLYKKF